MNFSILFNRLVHLPSWLPIIQYSFGRHTIFACMTSLLNSSSNVLGGPQWIILAISLQSIPSSKVQVVSIQRNFESLWQNSANTASFISIFDSAVNISTNLNLMRFIGNPAGFVILTPTSFFIPRYTSAHAWRVWPNRAVLDVFAWCSSNSTESRE